jgi:hypothetical protein
MPDSHTTLYNWVNLLQRPELGGLTLRRTRCSAGWQPAVSPIVNRRNSRLTVGATIQDRVKVGVHFHTYEYRYANGVPIRRSAVQTALATALPRPNPLARTLSHRFKLPLLALHSSAITESLLPDLSK